MRKDSFFTHEEESAALWFANWILDNFNTSTEKCYRHRETGTLYFYYEIDKMFKLFVHHIEND